VALPAADVAAVLQDTALQDTAHQTSSSIRGQSSMVYMRRLSLDTSDLRLTCPDGLARLLGVDRAQLNEGVRCSVQLEVSGCHRTCRLLGSLPAAGRFMRGFTRPMALVFG
jgi:hypothetical protein